MKKNKKLEPKKPAFPIVGIGASAGGLQAFEEFFSGLPADAELGMAFVLVQHLAPDHSSILPELIQRFTHMPVHLATDGLALLPDHVYIIAPNTDLSVNDATLCVTAHRLSSSPNTPISRLLSSVAIDQKALAVGIIFSGGGSDGSEGIKAIKAGGGLVLVQRPETAGVTGMPLSAIATGAFDLQLAPQEMPAKLLAWAQELRNGPSEFEPVIDAATLGVLRDILEIVRLVTRHDFAHYKPNTLLRRVQRRMDTHKMQDIAQYRELLRQTPAEASVLFHEFLIGVTRFFRDSEIFLELEKVVLPKLLQNQSGEGSLRVWCVGCATGEEAYSIAILFQELQEKLGRRIPLQIFATDIDDRAIALARAGRFGSKIAEDVSPARLLRFFTRDDVSGEYCVVRSIRDAVVFSEQDVVKDPPFSNLDLIICRNLLIYFDAELQNKILPLFHFALRPGGHMMLGASESVGGFSEIFSAQNRESRIYKRLEHAHISRREMLNRLLSPVSHVGRPPAGPLGTKILAKKPSLRELTEGALLRQSGPMALMVNAKGDILYQHGRSGLFLEPVPGVASINNALQMARDGLKRELTITLHKAVADRAPAECPQLQIKGDAGKRSFKLRVSPERLNPFEEPAEWLYLVTLEELVTADIPAAAAGGAGPADAEMTALREALKIKEEYLDTTNEELRTSNEELRSANEEMQSINEEVQSTNEEMETSREELQSVNEELATVNAELQAKVFDLSTVNSDMSNLLAGTGIATVFLDRHLKILRFTPAAIQVINLLPTDLGRQVSHLANNLVGYNDLEADAQAVLDTLHVKELAVRGRNNRHYLLRLLPYRTLDNVIEGVVAVFIDITEAYALKFALEDVAARLKQVADALPQLIWVCEPDGEAKTLNHQWIDHTGVPEARQLGQAWLDQIFPQDRQALLSALKAAAVDHQAFKLACRIRNVGGAYIPFHAVVQPLFNPAGEIVQWFGMNTLEAGHGQG